ncbi:hypothetical protein Hanom_Chr03g00243341 [Helianthus anomalus]
MSCLVMVRSGLDNATICDIIKTLIHRKYQRCIHHAFTILHTSRYLSHLPQTNVLYKPMSCINQCHV